ncbi:lysophospholipid acyltransferase family protein [Paracoccaceae bacterium]|nr:lysophospholipid acyltransferase family protein [Paracoccaceae bacterium]
MLRLFPFNTRVKLGGLWCKYLLPSIKKYKSRVKDNLELIYPHMSLRHQKNFIRENSQMIGESFTELMFNKDFQKKLERIKYCESELIPIKKARKKCQPVVIISGHIGSWEAVRAVLKKHNLTSGALYQKNQNFFYEKLHLKAIRYGGEPIFEVGTSGTRKMISSLRSGGTIAMMVDQAVSDGKYFPFLGKPARTSTAIADLSLKYNVLLVPAFGIRKIGGYIEVKFDDPIKLESREAITNAMNLSLERRILENPTQWYWPHRRWK